MPETKGVVEGVGQSPLHETKTYFKKYLILHFSQRLITPLPIPKILIVASHLRNTSLTRVKGITFVSLFNGNISLHVRVTQQCYN